MKRDFLKKKILITGVLSIIMMLQASDADAWWPHKRYERRYAHPRQVVVLPRKYVTINVAEVPYYYHEGVYYRQGSDGYVMVRAPRGAIVKTLPSRRKVVVIKGRKYYVCDNVYYVQKPLGYVVVSQPTFNDIPQATTVSNNDDVYVVHVPNANGSYTPVVLEKSNNGYIGPQGEFYLKNPTIDQLKVLYAK